MRPTEDKIARLLLQKVLNIHRGDIHTVCEDIAVVNSLRSGSPSYIHPQAGT